MNGRDRDDWAGTGGLELEQASAYIEHGADDTDTDDQNGDKGNGP